MANLHDKEKDRENKDAPIAPDPETLHTTDPQDHMKGPVSSSVQTVKKETEKNNVESKEEADRKKEKNL
jgi:hypothetical protein